MTTTIERRPLPTDAMYQRVDTCRECKAEIIWYNYSRQIRRGRRFTLCPTCTSVLWANRDTRH